MRLALIVVVMHLALSPVAEARWRPQIPNAVKQLRGKLGDRLTRFRSLDRSMTRAERLYERGASVRSLSILRGVLGRKSLSPKQRARTLLYVGAIQTQLGNHDQAVRAFAGVAHHQPNFDLPKEGVDQAMRSNFNWGRHLSWSGATRSETISAQLLPGQKRPSLLNRARGLRRRVGDKLWSVVLKSPRLTAIGANTIGRINIWRALNTLENHGVPRFKVNLEADRKQFAGYTRRDGTVAVNHSMTLRYPMTLNLLAHESYHIMAPNELSRTSSTYLGIRHDSLVRIGELRQQGRLIPKTTAAGRTRRKTIAADLRSQRKLIQRASKALWNERLKEEGAAERFAGKVLGRENLPLTHAIHSIASSPKSPYHPSPKDNARYFMDGVSSSVEEMTGMKVPRQMNRQRQQVNRMVERLNEQR
jgi:hypothetical protein